MANLFSSFDPSSILSMSLNWSSSLIVVFSLYPSFWVYFNAVSLSGHKVTRYIHEELSAIMLSWSSSSFTLISVSLFLFIALNNFLGLFPYIFTSSSHLTFTISMALPLWVGHMVSSWYKTPSLMLAHLVPLGTPTPLIPFMVLIELVSNIIRPLTLSVRLAANMIAGHLLLTLLSAQATPNGVVLVTLILMALVTLGTLEIGVSLIQAYVFSTLNTLYFNEALNKSLV